MKYQYIIHDKWTTQWGVEQCFILTKPKGFGWKLLCITVEGNRVFHVWRRWSIFGKLPINEFPI